MIIKSKIEIDEKTGTIYITIENTKKYPIKDVKIAFHQTIDQLCIYLEKEKILTNEN
jgi:DNA-binding Xre family transcriptional regulator